MIQSRYPLKPLSEIAFLYNGNSINKKTKQEKYTGIATGRNFIATKDIGFDGQVVYENGVKIPYEESKFKTAPAGSVFVCSEGGSAGRKTAYITQEVCFGNKLYAIVGKDSSFVGKYIYYYTRYNSFFSQFQDLMNGIIGGVSLKKFGSILIPYPEQSVQEKIVAQVEEQLSQLDSAVATMKKTKQQLEIYRQAVLKEAFDAAIIDCEMMSIEELLTTERKGMTTGPFGTMIKKQDHMTAGVPMLGIENIGKGEFTEGNRIFVTKEKAKELSSFQVHEGDLIISRSGTIGEICSISKKAEGSLLSTNLMRITLNKTAIRNDYFIALFQSKGIVLDQVKELCKGSTRLFLNQSILKKILFPVPSLSRQKKIISVLNMRTEAIIPIEETITQSLQQAEALRQSILKQAFEE